MFERAVNREHMLDRDASMTGSYDVSYQVIATNPVSDKAIAAFRGANTWDVKSMTRNASVPKRRLAITVRSRDRLAPDAGFLLGRDHRLSGQTRPASRTERAAHIVVRVRVTADAPTNAGDDRISKEPSRYGMMVVTRMSFGSDGG
jgi:hypothetical protein